MTTKVDIFSQKIVLIGAGNVAFHLANALHNTPHNIVQIYNRSEKRLADFKNITQNLTNNLQDIFPNANVYLLAVSDDAIEKVAAQLPIHKQSIVAHTSGATPSTVLQQHPHHGIFYPLQTFSRHKTVNWSNIPLCLDGNTPETLTILQQLAQSINPNIYFINDQQRQQLHVAAVFANNFTNHLFAIAQDILQKQDLSFDLLKPLIQETVIKIQKHPPKKSQTGPAVRGDLQTMQRHLDLLKNLPNYQQLYQLLSKSIGDF